MGCMANIRSFRRKIKQSLVLVILTGFIATALPQPANAQMAVIDPVQIAKEAAQFILDNIQWALQQIDIALPGLTTVIGQQLQTMANAWTANITNLNNRTNVQYQLAGTMYMNAARPTNYSWCNQMQATLTASNNQAADNAARIAMAKANSSPMADPVVNSQIILNECTLCFAPLWNQRDPGYSAWTALCGGPPAGCPNGNHAKQDTDASAVTAYNEYLVDPALPAQSQLSGVFTPMAKVTAEKYFPFVAALTFCQHLAPLQNPPPKNAPNSGISLGDLQMGPRVMAGPKGSTATDKCFDALAKRMQFDNTTNWPAGNPNPAANIRTRHDEQYAQCTQDHANHKLDDGLWNDCNINGRSQLQADHDREFGTGMATNQIYGAALTTSDQDQQSAQWIAMQDSWGEKINSEQDGLYNAIIKGQESPAQGKNDQPTQ